MTSEACLLNPNPSLLSTVQFQDALEKLQADPFFASILRQPRVQQAVRDLQRDPGSMRRHAQDKEVRGKDWGGILVVLAM